MSLVQSLAMSDEQETAVLAANQAFYDAFESLEISRMESVWSREDEVTCVHPGWPILTGWFEVMGSWERILEGAAMMTFTITGAEATVAGEAAWVTCTENLTSLVNGRVMDGRIETTNLFVKREGRWLVVHHHGSPVGG